MDEARRRRGRHQEVRFARASCKAAEVAAAAGERFFLRRRPVGSGHLFPFTFYREMFTQKVPVVTHNLTSSLDTY